MFLAFFLVFLLIVFLWRLLKTLFSTFCINASNGKLLVFVCGEEECRYLFRALNDGKTKFLERLLYNFINKFLSLSAILLSTKSRFVFIIASMNGTQYTNVDIAEFIATSEDAQNQNASNLPLTPNEESLYNQLIEYVRPVDYNRALEMERRVQQLKELAFDIDTLPSLLGRRNLVAKERTPGLLIESLIKHQSTSDATLNLPSKATLGKGYIVAKIHTFSEFYQTSKHVNAPKALCLSLRNMLNTMVFSLMAEDVYIDLINDPKQPIDFRRQWASNLLLLWDHRNAQTAQDIAPVLNSLWYARIKLNPAFGTMMGTSELLTVSMQLDEYWYSFVKEAMKDQAAVQAMEEFLFGISYEKIKKLRGILVERNIPAVSLDQATNLLEEKVKIISNLNYKEFYLSYSIRRDNARARERIDAEGPHKTIEDYYVAFVTAFNQKLQHQDPVVNIESNS